MKLKIIKSLKTKFNLIFFCMAIVPMILIGFLILLQSFNLQLKQVKIYQQEVNQKVTNSINSFFTLAKEHLHILIDTNDLMTMSRPEIDETISHIVFHKKEWHGHLFKEIAVITKNGEVKGCASLNSDCHQIFLYNELKMKISLSEIFSKKEYFSSVSFDVETGEPFIILGISIFDLYENRLSGGMIAIMSFKEVWNIISNIQVGNNGIAYIVNQENRIIAHADPSLILKGTKFKVPDKNGIQDGLSGSKVILMTNKITIGEQNYYLITEIPLFESLFFTLKLILELVSIFIIFLISIFFMGFLILRNFIKPIETLAEKAIQIGKGDLSQKVDFERDDEIGMLANAFNYMIIHLKQNIISLESEIEKRKHNEEKLELSNKVIEQFTFLTSHDLQEPLRKVQAFGDILKRKYFNVLDEKGIDYIEKMQNATNRMQTMLDDLLIISRIKSENMSLSQIDLYNLVLKVIADFKDDIDKKKAHIVITKLPIITGDVTQMFQLFKCLIDNAFKFCKKITNPVLRIDYKIIDHNSNENSSIDSNKINKNSRFQILIQDNGIGFNEKYLDKIFQPFKRLHSWDKYKGNGIGLFICNQIVQCHNGNITAKSELNKGSTFIISLPANILSNQSSAL